MQLPSECTDAALEFWLRITTWETWPNAYDTLTLRIHSSGTSGTSTTVGTWSNLDARDYTRVEIPLGDYAG